MHLLVIDWDFFFKVPDSSDPHWLLYDWGHSESWSDQLATLLWHVRAAGFVRHGLPLPGLSGEEQTFWERFQFAPGLRVFVADSNVYAASPRVHRTEVPGSVTLFDAHHDCGYRRTYAQFRQDWRVSCEDWMYAYYAFGYALTGVYPRWHTDAFAMEPEPGVPMTRRLDDGGAVAGVFDTLFICRSGAWVPPWCDGEFLLFISAFPQRVELENVNPRSWRPEELSWHSDVSPTTESNPAT